MSGLRQGWLVALREMRERSRTRGFRAGLVIMLVVVVAAIVAPAVLDTGPATADVGLTGVISNELPRALAAQEDAVDITVRVHRYDDAAVGQEAVREEDIDVLVVDGRRLEWRGAADESLRAVVTGAIQLVVVQERATAAGIDPDELAAIVAPVAVENVELGMVAGRSPGNETAAALMSILLLTAILTYGSVVLSGVVEEKATRVVEVLLARISARTLLAGKVTGIGLLGLAQFTVTALAALVATIVVDSVDVSVVSGGVLAWVVVWFVLGYALYAIAYGALGSLASQTEDASSVAGPVSYIMLVGYWVSYVVVATDPDSGWSRLVSLFPATAPFAMPGRIALGVAVWWEPLLAASVTLAAIAGLVVFAGRVYAGAILHSGPRLTLRAAWRRATTPASGSPETGTRRLGTWPRTRLATPDESVEATEIGTTIDRRTTGVLVVAVGVGVAVAVLGDDVVMGVALAAGLFAVVTRVARMSTGHSDRHPSQR